MTKETSHNIIAQSYIFKNVVSGLIPAGEIFQKLGEQKYKELNNIIELADKYVDEKGLNLNNPEIDKFDSMFPIDTSQDFFIYIKEYSKVLVRYGFKELADFITLNLRENKNIKMENKIKETIAMLEKVSGKKVVLEAKTSIKEAKEEKETSKKDKKEDKTPVKKTESESGLTAATQNADEPILGNIIPTSAIKQMDVYVSDTLAEIDKATTQLRAIKRQISSGAIATSEDFSTLTERIAFLVKQLSRVALYSSNSIKAGKFDKKLLDLLLSQKELAPTTPLAPSAPIAMPTEPMLGTEAPLA